MEFLQDKGIKISNDPNAKLSDEQYNLVAKEYSKDSEAKKEAKRVDLKTSRQKKETVTIDNINEHIDYSLVEDSGDTVPQEAIRIARLLGVDCDLLDSAEHYLEENITNTRGQAKAENAAPGEITNK